MDRRRIRSRTAWSPSGADTDVGFEDGEGEARGSAAGVGVAAVGVAVEGGGVARGDGGATAAGGDGHGALLNLEQITGSGDVRLAVVAVARRKVPVQSSTTWGGPVLTSSTLRPPADPRAPRPARPALAQDVERLAGLAQRKSAPVATTPKAHPIAMIASLMRALRSNPHQLGPTWLARRVELSELLIIPGGQAKRVAGRVGIDDAVVRVGLIVEQGRTGGARAPVAARSSTRKSTCIWAGAEPPGHDGVPKFSAC